MKRNAFATLASRLSIGLLTLGMTFGTAQLSRACEVETLASAPEALIVLGAAEISEPSIVVTIVAPAVEPAADEQSVADRLVNDSFAVEAPTPPAMDTVETAPATEATASVSESAQTEQAALDQEPQYTGSTVSENEGNALVWYPEVEITIAAAPVVEEGGADE
jgi:hypothetical protein